eukprot:SAG31_NODE_30980_length_374_cov_0.541818_1_plen_36_part_10
MDKSYAIQESGTIHAPWLYSLAQRRAHFSLKLVLRE